MARFIMRKGKLVPIEKAGLVAKVADNGEMRSMAMGCPCKKGQAKRLKAFAKAGVQGRFHPSTGEFIYGGGYHAQRRAAAVAGLQID